MKTNKNKGFTLAELLIVVAIIAVLVSVSIPIFTSQLEKSREATDLANARNLYAEVMNAAMVEDDSLKGDAGSYSKSFSPVSQKVSGWQTESDKLSIAGIPSSMWLGQPEENGSCKVTFNPTSNTAFIIWSGTAEESPTETGPTKPEPNQATNVNTATANSIGNSIQQLMESENAHPNTNVSITVHPDGSYDVSLEGKQNPFTEDQIRAVLGDTISYEDGDSYFNNGYVILVERHDKSDKHMKTTITRIP